MKKLQAIDLAAQAVEEKKAAEVVKIDIRSRAAFTDFFLVATGLNRVHTRALADYVEQTLAAESVLPFSKEGYPEGDWILLDYLDFVIHIFTPEARDYYQLERLWHADS